MDGWLMFSKNNLIYLWNDRTKVKLYCAVWTVCPFSFNTDSPSASLVLQECPQAEVRSETGKEILWMAEHIIKDI